MAKLIQRFSLWKSHGERCVYCNEPLLFKDMTYDHILPKHLKKDPEERKKIFSEYGLGENFNLEGYENWVPCHYGCNRKKDGTIYDKTSTIFLIELAKSHLEKIQKFEDDLKEYQTYEKVLVTLAAAVENDILSENDVHYFLQEHKCRDDDQIVISFGLMIEDAIEKRELDEEKVDIWKFCEKELMDNLRKLVSCEYFICESDDNGESFSIRVAFVDINPDEISRYRDDLWELLEVAWYSDIYDELPSRE
jgi:hypothetical protein